MPPLARDDRCAETSGEAPRTLLDRLDQDGWRRCPACGAHAREGHLDAHREERCLAR